MASLGDSDAQIKPLQHNQSSHSSHADTQPFDSHIFPSSFLGEKVGNANEVELAESTVPFDDTVPVDDAFETQVVDLGYETQVVDDPLCPEYMDTQLIDNSSCDSEGTDETEVLDDSDGFYDDESQRRVKRESLDREGSWHTSLQHNESILVEQRLGVSPETPIAQISQEPKPGSIARFTSVLAASLRASGLAACRIALEETNKEFCSLWTNNQLSEENAMKNNVSNTETWKEVDQVCGAGRYNEVKGLMNMHDCKLGRSTARKLFDEDYFVENKELASRNDNTAGGKERTCCDVVVGLSYINSQEPEELSQANAFSCVQKLIEENKASFDNEFGLVNSNKGKLTFVSSTKGPQSLAKKTNYRDTNRKRGVFDWDDDREDEGGGDIFLRRKEEFFGSAYLGQRSSMKPQNVKGKQLDGYNKNIGKSDVHNELAVQSDSRIVCHNKTAPEAEMNFRKNLVSEFDEQSNIATSSGKLEAHLTRNQMPQVLDVGLDTQIAAEAMEAVLYVDKIANIDANNVSGNPVTHKASAGGKFKKRMLQDIGVVTRKSKKSKRIGAKSDIQTSRKVKRMPQEIGVATRQSKKSKRIAGKSNKQTSISSQNHSEIVRNGLDMDLVKTKRMAKSNFEVSMTNGINAADKMPTKMAGPFERSLHDALDGRHKAVLTGSGPVKKCNLPEDFATLTPIARQTRHSLVASQLKSDKNVSRGCGEGKNCTIKISALRQNKAGASVEVAKVLDANGKASDLVSGQSGEPENFKSKSTTMRYGMSCPRRRSCRQKSDELNEHDNLNAQFKASTNLPDLNTKRKTRSSNSICLESSSLYQNFKGESRRSTDKSSPGDAAFISIQNGKRFVDQMGAKKKLPERKKSNAHLVPSVEHEVKVISDNNIQIEATEPSKSMCDSPVNYTTPVNSASPVCIGNEYFKQSCKKRLSRSCLMREVSNLCATEREPLSALKDYRKRRDFSNVRVLFSHHLAGNIIKQQKKSVNRLKFSIASSITDATHFVADKFVRTRNMLEAIASGKPVVTHLWLENVGRANYYIDEKKYILRDVKEEKEIGFNMPVSLAHARQHPLLLGRRVLITPSIKPAKEIISDLIKAVGGQAVERVGRSTLKDDVVPEDLLVLSCEEDYEVCVPLLEKGTAIYSSELLLNGIVTQKLEYERHQLFADQVKRTRSTIWLKRGGDDFIPVPKHK